MTDLARLDGMAQAALVRSGEATANELVEAAITRLEKVNPELNAVITPMFDIARTEAGKITSDQPLAGVPFILKDLVAEYAGVPMSEGSNLLKGRYTPDEDSTLVERYKAAGLVTIGKGNTPEFGLMATTEPKANGRSRNPWNTAKTTGGSSGGSAAAVAAGVVPAAHANDGGGSIRIPASCCGLFGLKPTRGRNPLGPAYGDFGSGLAAEHVVTRSVRDSAAILDASAGPAIGDPYYAPPQEGKYLDQVGQAPRRLRIAFSTTSMNGFPTHPDCIAAVNKAAKLCEDMGHYVEEENLSLDAKSLRRFNRIWSACCVWAVDYWCDKLGLELQEKDLEPATWAYYQKGKSMDAGSYLLAVTKMHELSRDAAEFFQKYDMYLTPTLNTPPWDLGEGDDQPGDPMAGMRKTGEYAGYTPFCNMTGQPAMSVPLYWNDDGLPVGAHFAGMVGDEATLFRLAAQLEEAQPWADRIPPINAFA